MPHPLLDPTRRPVFAHRGDRAHAPENTLEAMRRGLAAGADGVEFDVRLTRDGEVVVLHDPTLDRTTDARGPVAERTAAALRRVDAGARWTPDGRTTPFRGGGLGIPTLAEVLAAFPVEPLLIEIKVVAAAEPTLRQLAETGAGDRVVVGSFFDAALAPFRREGIATSAAPGELWALLPSVLLGRRRTDVRFDALTVPRFHRGIPVPVRGFARATGRPAHVWTVNDPGVAHRLWRAGVRGMISDDPRTLVAARDAGVEAARPS